MSKTKKVKKGVRAWQVILIVFLILVLAILLFAYGKLRKLNHSDLDSSNITINDFNTDNLKGYTNLAIFGVDSRENELVNSTRSDTIMVASINNKTKEVKLVSIYRDTFSDISGVGFRKINAAYANGGPELAISTINKHLDLDITDFVTVNFSAVVNVVNAIGGIEITIESDEIDATNKNIKDVNHLEGTNSPLLTSAGKQTLDGTQTLAYSRVRKTSGSDFRRTERQRNVLYAILDKAQSSGIGNLNNLLDQMLPQIYTSLSTSEIIYLAKSALSYKIVEDTGFPLNKKGATVNGASVVIATDLSGDVIELHKMLFGTVNYVPSKTVQEISATLSKY